MCALLNPVNRPWRTIKWPLVAHTVAMFSIVTVATAIYLNIQSVAYIDYRKSPHHDDPLLPGPLIYQDFLYSYSKANSVALVIMVFLNAWLADGLLVSPALNSIPQVSDTGYSSYVAAMLSIL